MSKKALFKNLLQEFIKHGKIKTTQGRARILQEQVDRVVSRAKVKGLMEKFVGRKSGFTRVTKLGKRAGDNAPMVLVEWVEGEKMEEDEGKGKGITKSKVKTKTQV